MKKKNDSPDKFNGEKKYHALFELAPVGISIVDKERRIIEANRKLKKITGLSDEDFKKEKHKIRKYLHSDGREFTLDELPSTIAIEKRRVVNDVEIAIVENGKLIGWSLVSAAPVDLPERCAIVITQDITERKMIEKKLEESTEELRELTHHFEEVRENERSSIARDLHDDLGQKLTALNMDLSWVKSRIGVQSKTVEKKLQQMQLLMKDTVESIQKISYGLRPSILDNLGLWPALEQQLKEFDKSSGIKVNAIFIPKDLVINNLISLVIFRLVQESFTNISRHSGASFAEIKIKSVKKILHVLIKDNGKGIDQDQIENKRSFGIIGMRERVKSIGGVIKITGNKGRGTEIFVKIPLLD